MQETVHIEAAQVEAVQQHLQAAQAQLAAAEAAFIQRCPAYTQTQAIDEMRQREYQRLDTLNHIYLDYTGGGLYAETQLRTHMELLMSGVYGNPHSSNPTSLASTTLDEQARHFIAEFFTANPEEYEVIFTANASAALRIVGESYPFEDQGQYVLAFDNHNSVNGIREFARAKGAPVHYAPVIVPDLRLDEEKLVHFLDHPIPDGNNLFAYPAQSNFSGVQHSLDWIQKAHQRGWDVLLDSAAFAPTNRLNIDRWQPDFVTISFYKIFGYPTGVGALIARRSALQKLRRPWFAGGTITVASVQGDKHFLEEGAAAFEDGTIDYLNLPAVELGLRHIQKIGIETIHERVALLTQYLLDEMTALKHDNGTDLIRVYGPINTEMRGGTISFNLYDPEHRIFDYTMVEGLANTANISLRTGCFCNPGAGEVAMEIQEKELRECLQGEDRMTFEQLVVAMTANGEHDTVGAVRVSLGIATNFRDVFLFVEFLKTFLNLDA